MPLTKYRQQVMLSKKYLKEHGYLSITFIQRKFQLNHHISKLIYEKVISSSLHKPKATESKQPFCLDKPQKIREKNRSQNTIPFENYGPPKMD
jgi:hypothetical protein